MVLTRHERIEPRHEISNNVVCATSKDSDQPAHTCSLIRVLKYYMTVKLLTKSKKEGKDHELIQSSPTPDPGHHMGK